MSHRAFLTPPPRMIFATIASISLGFSPDGSSPASVTHQLQCARRALGTLATPATRERAGGALSEHRLSLAPEAREIEQERERGMEHALERGSKGRSEGSSERARGRVTERLRARGRERGDEEWTERESEQESERARRPRQHASAPAANGASPAFRLRRRRELLSLRSSGAG
jgi:hypothetical protein